MQRQIEGRGAAAVWFGAAAVAVREVEGSAGKVVHGGWRQDTPQAGHLEVLLGASNYVGSMVIILLPWYSFWCHGIHIGAMAFILVPWF